MNHELWHRPLLLLLIAMAVTAAAGFFIAIAAAAAVVISEEIAGVLNVGGHVAVGSVLLLLVDQLRRK